MSVQQIYLNNAWVTSSGSTTFQATDPSTGQTLSTQFPVSPWSELDTALEAATKAFETAYRWPGSKFAAFLRAYADQIEASADALCAAAHRETALPISPRLADGELPRTTNQLRQAADAAENGSWCCPTIDTTNNIRSSHQAIGPTVIFGPNNFPFAFNSISGGDFAAAIAAGNPVIAKGHPCHPETTYLFAQVADKAAQATGMPPGFVQLIYHMEPEDGLKLVSDSRTAAIGYTGSRTAGLKIKEAADKHGKPIFLEMSSVNPVFLLPHALDENFETIASEFTTSCLMAAGQFCTNPGFVVLLESETTTKFIEEIAKRFEAASPASLLSAGTRNGLRVGVKNWLNSGAKLVVGGGTVDDSANKFENTLCRVDGETYLENPLDLQTEAFGNATLFVIAKSTEQMAEIAHSLEGNLTGCFYASEGDEELYNELEPIIRRRVGRLLNNKMPTGVAVSPAMNHGGPFPATGHPGFTAVGIPASLRRFSMLACYDNVPNNRLPSLLQDENPTGAWRMIDGQWTQS